MKKLFLIASVAVTMFSASCYGSGNVSSDDIDEPDSVYVTSKQEAKEVIDYYNKLIAALESNYDREQFGMIMECMGADDVSVPAPDVDTTGLWATVSDLIPAPEIVNDELRKNLEYQIMRWFAAGKRFVDNYSRFVEYRNNREYKKDNWALSDSLFEENNILGYNVFNARSEAINIIQPLVDSADEVLLDGNPFKEHVVAGKKILSVTERIVKLVQQDDFDSSHAQSLYDELCADISEAAAIKPVSGADMAAFHYQNFLEYAGSFRDEFKKSVLKTGSCNRKTLYSLIDYRNMAIDSFNEFVG